MSLRLGINAAPYSENGLALTVEAERLGVDSVWAPEAWGYDALTPLAFLAARTTRIRLATGIVQLGARSPALLAMSALSLQALSRGRFVLGIGVSGPQVMEGWHGVRFTRPLQRTRETIEIVRAITAGTASITTARCTRCRSRAARAGASARRPRRRPCRSTSPRWGRPTSR